MLRKLMPLLVVAAYRGLDGGGDRVPPADPLLPVVDFFAPGGMQTTFLQPGQTKASECEHMVSETAKSFEHGLPRLQDCPSVRSGPVVAQRRALTREPIARRRPARGGALIVVFSARIRTWRWKLPQKRADVPLFRGGSRLRCFGAGVPR